MHRSKSSLLRPVGLVQLVLVGENLSFAAVPTVSSRGVFLNTLGALWIEVTAEVQNVVIYYWLLNNSTDS